MEKNKRPVNLDLIRFRFPITAILSIAHRITGVVLVLWLPVALYILDLSLTDEAGFEEAKALLAGGGVKFLLALSIWALAHHFFAGLRFLLIDFEVGVEKEAAVMSAKIVLAAGVLTFIIGLMVLM